MSSNSDFLNFALDAAWQAGRITLGHFQTGVAVQKKADNSPLTIADQQAEQKLRQMIKQYWPEHNIIGEEYGRSQRPTRLEKSPYTWILDPIDGTKSFVCGVPLYANLVALLKDDEPILGVINLPALDEMVYAVRDGGCFWNGRPAHVSTTSKMEDSIILTSAFNTFAKNNRAKQWQKLSDASYEQRTWGDGYGYALVATGRADVMVDPIMSVWDVAPMQVIMEEAGGTLTDWQGKATIHNEESIATNKHLLQDVMTLIK
ncbi:MAG: inositol monophosphatase family protein [Chloroflexi bacterium]|nr:inositol monophosphatase family protein [Chloroflexota bacterium]